MPKVAFLLSLALSFFISIASFQNYLGKTRVLGSIKEVIPTLTSTPTPTPLPTATPTPTFTPISSPTPTLPPTPTLTPVPIVSPANLEPLFNQYALHYGVDKELLKRIADCESKFNAGAIGAGGKYVGLYQFGSDIWVRYREEMGLATNPDFRLDANESIKTAAYLISKGKLFLWPNCVG